MSEFRLASPVGTPGTVRRAKRGAADGVVMTSTTTPKTIVAEAKFEGLTLEGVNQNLVDIRADEGEVEAVSREEEIIKKRKTELTTTRQIETRIKRQLLLEDGKVIEDSGPIVSTNTTEDTDRQETVQTEHRTLGDPTEEEVTKSALDGAGNPVALEDAGTKKIVSDGGGGGGAVGEGSGKPKTISAIVARPDGLLRNTKEEVEVSREETKECTVMAERKHFGDFTDDAYLRAITSGVDDIRELLLTEEARLELAPSGPQLVSHSTKSRKVVDSEDTDIQLSAKPDGTLVTEKTQTRQHEVLFDDDLPGDERLSTGIDQVDSAERIIDQKVTLRENTFFFLNAKLTEEIIKKRKTELTTTRQIETRIKRQLLLEDGKVIEDSGPIVSTNTTEDTDRQETVQTEHRTLGDPTEEEVTKSALDAAGNPVALEDGGTQKLVSDGGGGGGGAVAEGSGKPKTISAIVARPDGLLRNTKEEVEVSREETKECTVMAERKHYGDFTDDVSDELDYFDQI
ncbi:hypothetical protein quinque_014963 [Culex quinquefasciatus]